MCDLYIKKYNFSNNRLNNNNFLYVRNIFWMKNIALIVYDIQ